MTDEKRLPWKSFEAKIGLSFFTKSTREIIVPVERDGVFYVIPEPEARRLHALDSEVVKLNERVKKFEEVARSILRNPGSSSLDSAKRLLRDAMGEK